MNGYEKHHSHRYDGLGQDHGGGAALPAAGQAAGGRGQPHRGPGGHDSGRDL